MSDTYIISGLRRKRAEIAGIITDHERKAREWRAALVKLDATLKLFAADLDPDTIPAKRTYRNNQYFNGPELSRFVMDELRRADGKPIAAGQIYEAAVEAHGIPRDPRTKTGITERILRYLRERQEAGAVVKHGVTHDAKWTFAPEQS